MTKRRYTFTVLRYVHDRVTGEFVNVGIVAFLPPARGESGALRAATRHTIGRMRVMFPDLVKADFLSAMSSIDRAARKLRPEVERDALGFSSELDASVFAQRILVSDDSALQWSPVGAGLTEDFEVTFKRLFQRHVAQYDERSNARRSDEEVWKPVRKLLEERGVPVELGEKTIVGDGDKVHFQHAWKNGVWHAYEPVSLDLADEEGIVRKAHRWLGQLTSVTSDPAEPFHAHFIVGAPANDSLMPAYRRAIRILKKSPGSVDVYEERDLTRFVDRIEDEVRAHRAFD
ncbi:DUF3037 domain-containing protein [Sphingomonas sp. LM7]|uniref:DUF3037 domain-containing protein n=1 Tax=Sphingomonas sp. LM7 TaxID=1938607 RepID=UPI000983C75C|nr:DUF3037 domain-containing protein [Sphingomonas sp. LM7]AQR74097.1 hypothetical protein BXU08_10925 [Sphingomonas sp. LM7]